MEIWSGKRPDVSHLRVFGATAMVHIPKEKRRKFDPKSTKCIMVGYELNKKAYRLFNPETNGIVSSRDVVFIEDADSSKVIEYCANENQFYSFVEEMQIAVEDVNTTFNGVSDGGLDMDESIGNMSSGGNVGNAANSLSNDSVIIDDVALDGELFAECEEDSYVDDPTDQTYHAPAHVQQQIENVPINERPITRSITRSNNPTAFIAMTGMYDPVTVRDAMVSENSANWKTAMNDEFNLLIENRTWSLVELPPNRKAINSRWVFKTKHNASGDVERHKARLVVKGCAQKKGIDYEETFSPVVRYGSIRYLIAIAAKCNLMIDQMDAVTAFLHGDLSDEIYMRQPELFDDGTGRVCRLNKSLYGLKQASCVWNQKLDAALKHFGLIATKSDACVYHILRDRSILVVAVYVDDVIIISNDIELKNALKNHLSNKFKMKDMGPAKFVLGMRITRDVKSGSISIDQSQYIRNILDRFGMSDCNSLSTPMDANQKLTSDMCPKTIAEREEMANVPYQEAMGSILFAAQVSRPDIQFAVSCVSRFNNNPGKAQWLAVKRMLRYLKGTVEKRLTYHRDGNSEQLGYCDADFAGDSVDRRSTTGHIFILQNGAISWNSKKQHTVALSTTEAE